MPSTAEDFYAKWITRDGPIPPHRPDLGPCWLFTGPSRTGGGYGRVWWQGKQRVAHQVAWEIAAGQPLPLDLEIDHLCNNRLCSNNGVDSPYPSHLEAVTHEENCARREANPAKGSPHARSRAEVAAMGEAYRASRVTPSAWLGSDDDEDSGTAMEPYAPSPAAVAKFSEPRDRVAYDETNKLLVTAEALVGARTGVADMCYGAALVLADRIRDGAISDRHLHYAATAVERLVNIARLEQGKPTSVSATVAITATQSDAFLDGLREEFGIRGQGNGSGSRDARAAIDAETIEEAEVVAD